MLYLFYGTDTQKARSKVSSTVASLLKRKPDAGHFSLDAETFSEDALKEYLGSQGLFAGRYIVVLDNLFENKEAKGLVLDRVKDISGSENIFILLEGKLDKKTATKLEKHAEKSQTFEVKKEAAKRDTTIFKLTDALGSRNRSRAWVEYQRALRSGGRPEEIHGMLFWQTKTMLLVSQKSTAGLKPFVVSKAKKFLGNWSEDELKILSSKLVSIYHDARRGGVELDIGLERLILSL